jgi:general stress protein 26
MAQSISPVQNLTSSEAVEKIKELAEKAKTFMFTTSIQSDYPTTRPMTVQEVDENGCLWFISSAESHNVDEIRESSRVQLYFSNTGSYEFLYVLGEASLHTDKALIDKYWTDIAKAWFSGKDDPMIRIVKVKPVDAYYWDTKYSKIVSLVKIGWAALTGAKMEDGGIEGELKP